MTQQAVTIRSLGVVRGSVEAIRDITVGIPAGSITGLLGPSGSGKTTLMRAIVGTQRITSGTIEVLGERAGAASLRRRIGYMAQVPALYADLSVRENLAYFAAVLGESGARVEEVIGDVDLLHRAHALVRELSGGEVNRTSLAVALLARPALLVLDEPTVGLDPLLRESLWRQFRQLADAGTTLLVSSHVMDEARRCDSLLLLREGSLLFQGGLEALQEATGALDMEAAYIAMATRGRP